MREEIKAFADYLQNEKKTARNTLLSYERDLRKMADYFEQKGKENFKELTADDMSGYMEHMKEEGKKASTLSRSVASIKSFYQFMIRKGEVKEDLSAVLKAPRVEKKLPSVLALEDVDVLLAQPSGNSDKEVRDKAMLELLYATGIRVSELLSLKLDNLNLKKGYITIQASGGRERIVPFTKEARDALNKYLTQVRESLLEVEGSDILFVNMSGKPMSRQGFWKIIKYYTKRAGIEADITPNTLRHTFAAHLVKNGANLHAVQEMMGHSDFSSTQKYTKIESVREEYEKAHPRG
jgi:integrase/recombinase XerD